ncbi:hypothetical protein [Nesterenkonia haasae]|uniref:hypothetical protein n=1 Tax=Nesterenkonia haasae TaxID=2587813 RepID=UPI00139133DB|nr:hypothetical protein [Nesterenkonia haasae]NDK30205.1 hypothetical protein [Nesterenkonia haasae]
MSTADADGPSDEPFEPIAEEIPGRTEQQAFEEFSQDYPRKEAKKGAPEKFDKALRVASAQNLTDNAHRFAVDPNREQGYTKLPTTWLHGEHWNDPPLPPRQPNGGRQTATQRKMQTAQERHQRLTGLRDNAAPWTLRQIEED